MSILTFEKPVPKVAESDWYFRVTELKEVCDNLRNDVFELRNESHKLRDETDVTTSWSTHRTNSKIIDRRTEITQWKNLIDTYYKSIQNEITDIKNEKKLTEEILEQLNLNFTITNHCLSIRDERGGADLCHDIAQIELKNEQNSLENLKKLLTEVCEKAWEQINQLEELRINVAEDLENKMNTIKIDSELLEMTKNSTNISLKPDPCRIPKNSSSYEKWLRHCNNLKQRIENELLKSKKLKETMYVPRNKTENELRANNDSVNYALRKRIHDTERIKNELEWQKKNMLADKGKFLIEIEKLEDALDRKLNPKKLIETRCEERLYRLKTELCLDKTTNALREENVQMEYTIQMLTDNLNQSKSMHNILVEQINVVNEELVHKLHALAVDQKCLEYRKKLLVDVTKDQEV